MKHKSRLFGCVFLLFCGLFANGERVMPTRIAAGFEENKGQILDQNDTPNDHVIALHKSDGLTSLLNRNGFSYQAESQLANGEIQYHRIDIVFEEMSTNCRIEMKEASTEYSNYVLETASGVVSVNDVRSYQSVYYYAVYDGVDIEFQIDASSGKVKFNFLLNSIEDITKIKLRYTGQLNERLLNSELISKELILKTNLGTLTESVPASFLVTAGKLIDVNIGYRINEQGQVVFDFATPPVKCADCQLIIDPTPTVTWATYFGGTSADQGMTTAMDGFGFVYIGGNTVSSSAIATAGAHQGTYGGSPFNDAFIAKFDYLGARIWSTYFGGANDDQLFDLTTDGIGGVYFAGATSSAAAIATAGAYQTSNAGNSDAFFGLMNSAGVLQWASYFGGPSNDIARSIKVTGANIYICGSSASSSGIATAGAHSTALAGGATDGFLADFTLAGTRNWCTYYGGSLADVFYGVEVNSVGDIFVGGSTNSTTGIATAGAHQTSLAGNNDAMIVSFDASGARRWGTYMGGTLADNLLTISMDVTDLLLIAGQTYSNAGIATAGAYDTAIAGSSDGFMSVFDSSGARIWSTYLGGNAVDQCYFSYFDAAGNAYAGGHTTSSSGLSTADAAQTAYGGGAADAFIAQFTGAGAVQWVTYLGGTGDDYGRSAVVDVINGVFMTGITNSSSAISTGGSHQPTIGATSSSDAFLVLYGASFMLPITLLEFQAIQQGEEVLCDWRVDGENDCFHFHLERSIDGVTWTMLSEMECNASINGDSYQFLDGYPEKGLSYYRLSEVDQSGASQQFRIASVFFDRDSRALLFPVPAKDVVSVNVSTDNNELSNFSVFNSLGQIVFSQQVQLIEGSNTLRFSLENCPSGFYHMLIRHEDGRVTKLPFIHAVN
jgi:hypothetical protein